MAASGGYARAMSEPNGPTEEPDDGSVIDDMRDTGVGVEDPNIVGDPHPGIVEEHVAEDEPPQV